MNGSVATRDGRALWGNVALCALLGVLAVGLLALHAGEWEWRAPGGWRWAGALACLLAWSGFTAWTARRHRRQTATSSLTMRQDGLWVVHASQTGTAMQLAQQTAQALQQAGADAVLVELGVLDAVSLAQAGRVLFVVSTTGEGDAPDSAASFVTRAMREPAALSSLRYGLLALGDHDYDDFCGFGRQLQQWLQRSSASPLFDPVEVDNGDPAALRHWQHHLSLLTGAAELPDWQRPDYQRWRLVERRLLNPQSQGGACFHLALQPIGGDIAWQAGDLIEIGPRHAAGTVDRWLAGHAYPGDAVVMHEGRRAALREWLAESHLPGHADVAGLSVEALVATLQPLPHREYSIASLPADGAVHLLVRRMQRADGTPGIGSGWLTEHAAPGAEIAARVRANPTFRAPTDGRPLILIGNGTGLAGLRALLKARIAQGHTRNWLLFGERQAAHDFHYRDDIVGWQRQGAMERLDLAWSRDGEPKVYVQDLLRAAAGELRRWVEAGAAIYICGSLAGMAPGVDAVLREALGDDDVERLREQGRYRRDVY